MYFVCATEKVIIPLANVNPTRERQEATKPSPERLQELMTVARKEREEVRREDERNTHTKEREKEGGRVRV